MAADVVKLYVRGVFDNLGSAGPEARQLLKEFFAMALLFDRNVLAPAKVYKTYHEKQAWFCSPVCMDAQKDIRAHMTQLKAHGINLLGFSPSDVCEAIVELYSNKPQRP